MYFTRVAKNLIPERKYSQVSQVKMDSGGQDDFDAQVQGFGGGSTVGVRKITPAQMVEIMTAMEIATREAVAGLWW